MSAGARRPPLAARWLTLLGLVLLAFNLRPAAVSVGPLLAELRDGLGMSSATAGLLTSLPVVAFACFGAASPALARRLGVHRVMLLSLGAVCLGLVGRVLVDGPPAFLALSLLALAGAATANVLLPSLVVRHFPDRIGTVTALYTTALAIGLTAALTLSVPVAESTGGWRPGLGVWAVLALVAALPWSGLLRHDRALPSTARRVGVAEVARTRLGWAMCVFFGLQGWQAYAIFGWFAQLWRDAGYNPTQAGVLVGVVAAVSIPLSWWLPAAAARRHDQRWLMLAVACWHPVGYVLLLVAPHSLGVLAAVVVGVGASTFPLSLTLIALRSRTPVGTAALSGFTQSVGYLIAGLGPFLVGVLYGQTDGWTAPLSMLLVLLVPQILLGLYVASPVWIEDQLSSGREPGSEAEPGSELSS